MSHHPSDEIIFKRHLRRGLMLTVFFCALRSPELFVCSRFSLNKMQWRMGSLEAQFSRDVLERLDIRIAVAGLSFNRKLKGLNNQLVSKTLRTIPLLDVERTALNGVQFAKCFQINQLFRNCLVTRYLFVGKFRNKHVSVEKIYLL